MGDLIT